MIAWATKDGYRQVLRQFRGQILPADHQYSILVQKVMERLIPASGITDAEWEVFVIDAPDITNAFVIPGYVLNKHLLS